MIPVFLFFWIVSALLLVREQRVVRLIIFLSIYSLVTAVCFFLLAAPDVAMAQIVICAFSSIVFVITFEKYYSLVDLSEPVDIKRDIKASVLPISFTVLLFVLFVFFIPNEKTNPYLRDQYLTMFSFDIAPLIPTKTTARPLAFLI